MQLAASFVREHGGVQAARVFTHVWLALFGLWSWEQVPSLPPEIVLAPAWMPLNIYDFACWARQTIVALSIVMAHRPQRTLPFTLDELHGPLPWKPAVASSRRGAWLARLDRGVRLYQRHPFAPLRRLAMARAERWVLRRQEADGSWGGIQPPWVYSLMALHLSGYPLEHPVIKRGLEGIDGFMIEDGPTRRLEACQSPVWDTTLFLQALAEAGVAPEHEAIQKAARWLLGEQVSVRATRRCKARFAARRLGLEFANVNYPDVDDTAEVVLALSKAQLQDSASVAGALERAARWVEGMQSSGGGWGAFDAENTRSLVRELPFLDFGEVIDEPSSDVSAHALEMLAALGRAADPRRGAVCGGCWSTRRRTARGLGAGG